MIQLTVVVLGRGEGLEPIQVGHQLLQKMDRFLPALLFQLHQEKKKKQTTKNTLSSQAKSSKSSEMNGSERTSHFILLVKEVVLFSEVKYELRGKGCVL